MKNHTYTTKTKRLQQLRRQGTGLLLVLLLITQGFSQSIDLEGVGKTGFKGLRNIGTSGYYVQYMETVIEGKRAYQKVHLSLLDNDLKVTSDFRVPVRETETVENVAYNGDKFMLISSSNIKRTRTLTTVDREGNVIATKNFDKVLRRLLAKPAVILPHGDSDFVVINYLKEKKVGYSVERYDSNLEMKYSTVVIPDKKKLYPVDFFIADNQMYVLEFLTPDFSDYFEYHLAAYDIETGAEKFKVQLKNEESKASGFATFIKPAKGGGVITGGMFFYGNKAQGEGSNGFFASTISTDGTPKFTFVDWKEVKKLLKDNTAGIFGGATRTFMHDIVVNDDGSFTLVGENYREGLASMAGEKKSTMAKIGGLTSGNTDIAITVADYALMDFSSNAEFTGIRKLNEAECITVIKSSTEKDEAPYKGQKEILNVANILNNQGYFPYRFTMEQGEDKYLVSVLKYEPQIKELLYFTKLNSATLDTVSVEITSSELRYVRGIMDGMMGKLGGLGKLAKKGNKNNVANEFVQKRSDDPYDYRAKAINTRVIPSNIPGKIVIYDFIPVEDPNDKRKGLAKLMSMTGMLRVSYVDLPQ
ncbi:MAG: DUF6770 family protein [Cyclobacteriaceae bacterium]